MDGQRTKASHNSSSQAFSSGKLNINLAREGKKKFYQSYVYYILHILPVLCLLYFAQTFATSRVYEIGLLKGLPSLITS